METAIRATIAGTVTLQLVQEEATLPDDQVLPEISPPPRFVPRAWLKAEQREWSEELPNYAPDAGTFINMAYGMPRTFLPTHG